MTEKSRNNETEDTDNYVLLRQWGGNLTCNADDDRGSFGTSWGGGRGGAVWLTV